MEMGADFMPLYPMWSSWFSFYARRRTSSHSNPSCSHRRFAREPPPPSPIPVMPGIRRRPPGGPAGGGVQGVGGLPAGGEGPCASGCGATLAEFLRSRGATQRRHAEKGRPSSRWHSLLGKPNPCQAPALVTRGHRGLATLRLPLASRCIGLTRLSTGWSKFRLEQSAC